MYKHLDHHLRQFGVESINVEPIAPIVPVAIQESLILLTRSAAVRRIQWIELHEQNWFPSFLRDEITDALQFGLNLLKPYLPIAPLLQSALDSTGSHSVVDLCSGGGGPWLDFCRRIHGNSQPFGICLTDKHMNPRAGQNVGATPESHISAYPYAVDAMDVPGELKGFRTIFTSFHHFSPDQGRAILQNAVDARQGIGIFEITSRSPSTILLMFPWALMLFVCTPFICPFRLSRLFWTFLIPVIPLVLLVDGVVSCLRTYNPQELREIIKKLNATEYEWEVGENSKAFGGLAITYLVGYPRDVLENGPASTNLGARETWSRSLSFPSK